MADADDISAVDDDDVSLDPADADVEPEAEIEPDEVVAPPKKRGRRTKRVEPADGEAEPDADVEPDVAPRKTRKYRARSDESSVLLTDLLPPVPPRGPFQVSNVRKSTYFFS